MQNVSDEARKVVCNLLDKVESAWGGGALLDDRPAKPAGAETEATMKLTMNSTSFPSCHNAIPVQGLRWIAVAVTVIHHSFRI